MSSQKREKRPAARKGLRSGSSIAHGQNATMAAQPTATAPAHAPRRRSRSLRAGQPGPPEGPERRTRVPSHRARAKPKRTIPPTRTAAARPTRAPAPSTRGQRTRGQSSHARIAATASAYIAAKGVSLALKKALP